MFTVMSADGIGGDVLQTSATEITDALAQAVRGYEEVGGYDDTTFSEVFVGAGPHDPYDTGALSVGLSDVSGEDYVITCWAPHGALATDLPQHLELAGRRVRIRLFS